MKDDGETETVGNDTAGLGEVRSAACLSVFIQPQGDYSKQTSTNRVER